MILDAIKLYILVGCATGTLYTAVASRAQLSKVALFTAMVVWPLCLWIAARDLWRGGAHSGRR